VFIANHKKRLGNYDNEENLFLPAHRETTASVEELPM
jgi:hypothetical protein